MILRAFVTIIIVIAIIVGVLALALPRDQLARLIMFRDFFDVSIPILGFGALVKYLCSCRHHHCHDKDKACKMGQKG